MKTKAQIVQELLDEKKITAEDAVILLVENKKEYIFYSPVYQTLPANPIPWQPVINPFTNYSTID